MSRVVHFEFGAVEPERAVRFYEQVFGWKVSKFPGPKDYFLVTTGPDGQMGINGGILRFDDGQPRTVNTIGVASVDEFAAKVESAGGKVIVPKMAIPGIGWLVYCKDTEGNIFGIHQPDPAAR